MHLALVICHLRPKLFAAAPVGWPTCASASRRSRRRRCWRDVYMIPGEQGGGRRKRCMLCYYRQYGGHRGQANAKAVGIFFSMDTWSRCRVNARLVLAFLGVVKFVDLASQFPSPYHMEASEVKDVACIRKVSVAVCRQCRSDSVPKAKQSQRPVASLTGCLRAVTPSAARTAAAPPVSVLPHVLDTIA